MIALEKQYNYYLEHEPEFIKKYEGKYLVISANLDTKAFDTKMDAYQYGAETYGLGDFLLQECTYAATHTVNHINVRFAV